MKKISFSRSQRKGVTILGIVIVLIVAAYGYQCGVQKVCGSGVVEKTVRKEMILSLPKGSISVEVVDTPASREQGLSGRVTLEEDKGMLFIFEHSGKYGFWMKDMLFPIDIVWINEEGVVVHIEREVTPESYFSSTTPQTFVNTPDAKYVLEVAKGQAEVYGLYLGTKVIIEQ